MAVLMLGLLLFLGAHSVRIVAEPWRERMVARLGDRGWKGAYTLVSVLGLVLMVWGFGLTRQQPVLLWLPPPWTRHLAALLTWPAFVLLVAAYVPGNGLKARVHHPMILGVKIWALAHLLANQMLAEEMLFGAFLAWAVFDYRAARQRDRAAGTVYAGGQPPRTALTVVIGTAAWLIFAFWAHGLLIGVKPFGG